jgi:DNA-binding NtrC family response regulator
MTAAVHSKSSKSSPVNEKQEIDLRGGECILIADDSQSIRDVAEYVLCKLGYRPILAADGETAVDLYREKRGEISLIVLDLIMPGMGGRECLEEILKIDPEAKVILVTGYTDEEPPEVFLEAGAKEYVNKPYDVKDLARLIRRVLDHEDRAH